MADAIVLSQDDRNILQRMLDEHRTRRQNTRKSTFDQRVESPDVHVVKLPPAGIPPIVNIIGGADRVYSADCDVYRIEDTGASYSRLVRIEDYQIKVHNVSTKWADDCYAVAVLERSGRWVIDRAAEEDGCPTGTGSGTGPTGTGTGSTGTGSTGTGSTGTGSTGTGTGSTGTGSEETGTGTVIEPCLAIPGLDLSQLPIETNPSYVLGVKEGCLVLVPAKRCPLETTGTGSGTGSGS